MNFEGKTMETITTEPGIENLIYAREIQRALMPKERHFRRTGLEYAIFYKSKDVLCGDFYWMGIRENMVMVAVGDCTGHGISAALLSVLGINLLNYIVFSKNISTPGGVLEEMDKKWIETFQDEMLERYNNDWCDISVCFIDKINKKVLFSGAHAPLLIIGKNHREILLRGERYPIGGWQLESNRKFHTHEFSLEEGDILVLLTDGIVHQFGGHSYKKFGLRQLKKILHSHHAQSLHDIMDVVVQSINQWTGGSEATDDRTLLLLRI